MWGRQIFVLNLFESTAFVNGYVVGLAGFDLVLGIVGGGVMDVSLVIEIFGMDLRDRAGDDARLGVPGDVVTCFKCWMHRREFIFLSLSKIVPAGNWAVETNPLSVERPLHPYEVEVDWMISGFWEMTGR